MQKTGRLLSIPASHLFPSSKKAPERRDILLNIWWCGPERWSASKSNSMRRSLHHARQSKGTFRCEVQREVVWPALAKKWVPSRFRRTCSLARSTERQSSCVVSDFASASHSKPDQEPMCFKVLSCWSCNSVFPPRMLHGLVSTVYCPCLWCWERAGAATSILFRLFVTSRSTASGSNEDNLSIL